MLCRCILDVSDASSYRELQGSAVFTCRRCQRSAGNDLQNRINTGQSYMPTGGSLPQQQGFSFFTIPTFIRVGYFWLIFFIVSQQHSVIPFTCLYLPLLMGGLLILKFDYCCHCSAGDALLPALASSSCFVLFSYSSQGVYKGMHEAFTCVCRL